MREVSPSPEPFWARQSGLFATVVVLIVCALGSLLDVTLLTEGFPRRDLMFLSNLAIGIVAGWLAYQIIRNEKAKREVMRQRMRTVAELNHHIRNALQVIRYAGGSKTTQDATQLQLINEAVARIEWALQEVLPMYPHGSAAPGDTQYGAHSNQFPTAVVEDFILRHKETRPQ